MSRKFFVAALAAVVLCASAASSQAALSIRVGDGTNWGTVTADLDGDGFVTANGTFAGWAFSVVTSLSKPLSGTASMPYIDVTNQTQAGGSATGPLYVQVSDDNFGGIDPNFFETTLASSTAANQGVSLTTWLDSSNTLFAKTTALGSTSISGVAGDTDFSGSIATGNPYSLTLEFIIQRAGSTVVNSTGTLEAVVPEAASVAVWGGLSLVGLVARRRRG